MRLVDTDILIDHFHNVKAATEYIAQALLEEGQALISAISVAEILAGMRAGEEGDTEALFAFFTIVPADEMVARIAGNYLNQFGKSFALDLGDALIAATAKIYQAELITRNVRHYPMKDTKVRVPYERGKKRGHAK